MDAVPIALQRKDDIERIAAFGRAPGSGMVILPNAAADIYHQDVIRLAARYRLPAISFNPAFVADGGLMAYGPDDVDLFRKAASYVDRILRGAQPGDLPVQEPTKFAFAINMKTARSLGITLPEAIVLQATGIIR
jgi:putative ABC transport system substrate-binding protein